MNTFGHYIEQPFLVPGTCSYYIVYDYSCVINTIIPTKIKGLDPSDKLSSNYKGGLHIVQSFNEIALQRWCFSSDVEARAVT